MMNRTTRKAILAAIVSAGIISPAQGKAALFIPQAPAIIKPAEFWKPHEKKLILGMPLTMGMLKPTAPNIIGSPTAYAQVGFPTPHTLSHTTVAGTKSIILVFEWGRNAAVTVTTVTWDGGAMSLGGGINDTTGSERSGIWIYYINSPAIKTANIVVTTSGSEDAMVMRAFNVDKTVTVNVANQNITQVDSGDSTVSLVTTTRSLILGGRAKSRVTGSMVPASGVTEVADVQNGPGGIGTFWFGKIENAPAATYNFGAAITSAATGDSIAAVAFS